ncbi:MAG: SDR family oxidoreductase [Acidimicrobiales bacterium]
MEGRRILVVGGSSGVGRAVGLGAAQRGARVAFAARREDRCATAASEAGVGSIGIRCDVRDPSACESTVRCAVDHFGGLDALVYATGMSPLVRLADADAETWKTVLETNLVGAALICRAALAHLRESTGRGVFLSSSSVGRPYPGLGAYATSKAALEEMIRAWRAENPEVCFSCVTTGPTAGTDFVATWDMALAGEMFSYWQAHGYDAGVRTMNPEEMASVVIHVLESSVCILNASAQAL